jgi:hypothetical protein
MSTPPSSADAESSASLPDRRPGLPRRPGVFPDGYPASRLTTRVIPIPGEPLPPAWAPMARRQSTPMRSAAPLAAAPAPEVPGPDRRHVDRSLTMRGQRPNLLALKASYRDFPPVSGKPPHFKPHSVQYPSGAAMGTEQCKPFEEKLRELMLSPT